MKQFFKNYRYYVLTLLMVVATIGIFSVPADALPAFSWLAVLIITKVIGFAAGWAIYRLTKEWERENKIPELTELLNDI